MDVYLDTRVRELAYQLWEADGCPEGTGDAYWHRAEAELERQEELHDQTMENTFPASDPPANTGVVGPTKTTIDTSTKKK